ncbi:MAG: NAD(+) synthase, partial [Geopsychrobacter sp.]|nr:NAD(+) synthase [Geopsychrobacter sp.]
MSIDLKQLGMLRMAVVTPELRVADVAYNLAEIKSTARDVGHQGASLALYPELSLSGYTCADLFYEHLLQQQVVEALLDLARFTITDCPALIVGAPLSQDGRLFNCAVLIANGAICGVVPKIFLPNRGEFYEQRWVSAAHERTHDHLDLGCGTVPFGEDLLFQADNHVDLKVGIELCEDLWAVEPPSGSQALAGAPLLLNLSASPEILGKPDYRKQLVASQSARCLAAYAYASAGPNESSTDLVFSGHSLIAEYGQILTETQRYRFDSQWALADLDLQRLNGERQRNSSFNNAKPQRSYRVINFTPPLIAVEGLLRPLNRTPFVPPLGAERAARCQEILALQTSGLAKRLKHTGCRDLVIGLSGGL